MSNSKKQGDKFRLDHARARGEVLVGINHLARAIFIICGARTRKGTPCKAKALPGKKRCKFHGGLSTGPKTPEGCQRIAAAQRKRWAKWRQGQSGLSSASSEG